MHRVRACLCASIDSRARLALPPFCAPPSRWRARARARAHMRTLRIAPGMRRPEFEEVVFGLYDTGELNPKNEAALFQPKYEEGVVQWLTRESSQGLWSLR